MITAKLTPHGESHVTETDASTRIDLHVKVLSHKVVARAKARDIDILVYAPHFTRFDDIRSRAAQFSDEELLVIPAREIFTGSWHTRRHILGVGLNEPIPDFISLTGALDALERQDAATLIPHPEFMNVSLSESDIQTHTDAIDAIEVYNFKSPGWANTRGISLIDETDHQPFGSSYAHLPRSVGRVWTTFDCVIDSEADLVEALKSGVSRRVYHEHGLMYTAHELIEFAHLIYENSWKKLDRLLLSGMEPTHPGHIAYDGQYDDVAEY
ncbi:PHP-associated domain-containing protein [Haloquadratum walsbyi]|jgi:Predicted metal-dependent phosphoesterases (PHP family)|uniref:Putative metal-dependent phosphoesterases (PHP family) n=1 Tax=Haloquadratum walsbyi J07HQW2 TaxID=1238425 RepID=U1PRL0_9EURY|nr:PHP-associated domain-containing protein [Haloquadratum walsbyi]ERG96387.1 MAG: putative metal-dependent phosphoesterases (PHP family) [Haloquadratum walsbyi J07HQW2]